MDRPRPVPWRLLPAVIVLTACGSGDAPPAALRFDFIAYGDCRHKPDVHRRLCDGMVAADPSFVVNTGDLVDSAEKPDQWDVFRSIVGPLRVKAAYFPVRGDHDTGFHEAEELKKEFGLDRLYYDRRIDDVHLFCLDSDARFASPDQKGPDAEQLGWLERTAAASTAKHKIAVFHHPPFIPDPDRSPQAAEMAPRIHPLLVRLKFCAALCGHEHAFYTTTRDGLRYVVTGGGGAPLMDLDASQMQPGDQWKTFHHYVGCRFDGSAIRAQVVGEDGKAVEGLSFTVCEHGR